MLGNELDYFREILEQTNIQDHLPAGMLFLVLNRRDNNCSEKGVIQDTPSQRWQVVGNFKTIVMGSSQCALPCSLPQDAIEDKTVYRSLNLLSCEFSICINSSTLLMTDKSTRSIGSPYFVQLVVIDTGQYHQFWTKYHVNDWWSHLNQELSNLWSTKNKRSEIQPNPAVHSGSQ